MAALRHGCLWLALVVAAGCCCPENPATHLDDEGGDPGVAAQLPADDARAAGDEAGDASEADGVVRIRPILEAKRVRGLAWEDMPLLNAVMYLRTISGQNFFVAPDAVAAGAENVRITLTADDVSLAAILNQITEENGLVWDEHDGVVRIRKDPNAD